MRIEKNKKILDNLFNIIVFIPFLSYVLGFYLNENSAGMGEFAADSTWIKSNINIFLQNDIRDAIFHPDLFGNRPPLIYILNKFLNPFFGDFEKYRLFVFIMSLLGPIIFYKFLIIKFYSIDKKILFLLASIIYLSPYYRTRGFWALNENYSIITMMLSFLFLEKFLKSEDKILSNILFIIFFSSLTVYFDQKFLIVPIVCFFSIIFKKINFKYKFITLLSYFILSLPYVYLIYRWNGIVPPATQVANPNTITSIGDIKNIYFMHIGYSATLISFYLFPLILLTGSYVEISKNLKKILFDKKSLFLFFVFIVYVSYGFFNFDFEKITVTNYWIGFGVVQKLTILITDEIFLRKIITYLFFIFSFILIVYFYFLNKKNFYLISYFLLISVFLWPLMQEYFDPIIFIISIALFKSFKLLNKSNAIIIMVYQMIFLLTANIYYN